MPSAPTEVSDEFRCPVPTPPQRASRRSVPYILKQFIDVVSQPGLVFGFDGERGYLGLVDNRKAAVIYTSAVYGDGRGPAFGADFQAPYFDDWLRWGGSHRRQVRVLPAQSRHGRRRERALRRSGRSHPGRKGF
jgi:FMN-dependent NADH-azoreductase